MFGPVSPAPPSGAPSLSNLSASEYENKKTLLFSAMLAAAVKGDSGTVASLFAYARGWLTANDYKQMEDDIRNYTNLEQGADALSGRLNGILAKGGSVSLGAADSPMRSFLLRAVELAAQEKVVVPAAVQKLLNGESLSDKEAKEAHDFVVNLKLKVVPADRSVQALQSKLTSLRSLEASERSQIDETTRSLTTLPQ